MLMALDCIMSVALPTASAEQLPHPLAPALLCTRARRARAPAAAADVQLVLANDPDADRLAAAEQVLEGGKGSGRFVTFSGNDIGLLLADWVWTNFRARHPEVRVRPVALHGMACGASACC